MGEEAQGCTGEPVTATATVTDRVRDGDGIAAG